MAFFSKKSFPVYLVTLLVTSQCFWMTAEAATKKEQCCPCDETSSILAGGLVGMATYFGGPAVASLFGSTPGGIVKDSIASKLMKASSKTGLGEKVVSAVQKLGSSKRTSDVAGDAAMAAYRAAKNRCCPCPSDEL